MAAWLQAATVLAGAGVVIAIVALAHKWTKESGASAYRADRAEAEVAVTKKQGDVIAEQRTVDDAAKRLDSGDF